MWFIIQSKLKERMEIPFILAGKLIQLKQLISFIPLDVMDQCGMENKWPK